MTRSKWKLLSLRLHFLIAVHFHIQAAMCGFDRGNRYWSGPPQPIGIDFGFSEVYAVYAHGPFNHTLLSRVQLGFGNPCYQYMHSLYRQELPRYDFNLHVIYKPLQRNDFIASAVKVLQEVRQLSVTNHNITVTSAIISRPEWMVNEDSDMIDEACFLAGIEVFEQPHSGIDMAAKTLEGQTPYNHILVLQLNHLGLGIYRRQVTEKNGEGSSSMRLELGTFMLHELLVDQVIQAFNGANVAGDKVAWTSGRARLKDVGAAYSAKWKLQNNTFWDRELDFELRKVDVNLTDASGELKELPLSGKEFVDTAHRFSYMVSEALETFLWNYEAIIEYEKGFPEFDIRRKNPDFQALLGLHNLTRKFTKTVPPPPGLTSWFKPVDNFVILDSTINNWGPLLKIVLGERLSAEAFCIRHEPGLTAAIGASMRALQWVGYWEAAGHPGSRADWGSGIIKGVADNSDNHLYLV